MVKKKAPGGITRTLVKFLSSAKADIMEVLVSIKLEVRPRGDAEGIRETTMAQETAQSTKPVLDRTKLVGLREMIGEAKCNAAIQRFRGELFACLAAIEGDAPERAVHAHNLAGVAGLLGFDDLEEKSRRFLVALNQNGGDVSASAESLLRAAQQVEIELDAIA